MKTDLRIMRTMMHIRQFAHISGAILAFLVGMLVLFPLNASATPDYARQTGFECRQCHFDVIGGGTLTQEGRNFLTDMKVKGLYRPLTMTQHIVRLFIGYFH